MEANLPAVEQGSDILTGCTLVTRTDSKGFITYVNDALVETSGYSREDLIGKHFNTLYHPDMPPTLLDGMKLLLKRGLPWHGIVKNCRKDGSYFWSDANVAPMRKNGETIGYMSVSNNLGSKLSRKDIAMTEAAYRKAANNGGGWKKLLSVKNGVAIGIVFVTLMMITGGILGISGLRLSSDAIRTLYHENMEPVRAIGRINFLMADNRAQVALALHHNPATHNPGEFDHSLSVHLDAIEKNRVEIDGLWESYGKLPRNGAEHQLSDEYWQARARYVADGLKPAKMALEQGDFQAAENLLLKSVNPLYREANSKVETLLKHLSAEAESNAFSVAERNDKITVTAVAGVLFGIIVVIFSGFFFLRGTVAPLESAIDALERIAEGNLSGNADTSGYGEPGRVMAAVAAMQINLKVMIDEIRQSSSSIHEQCRNLNHTMMNLAEHSEEQHDRVYQTLDSITRSCEELGKLAQNAEAVTFVAENSEKMVETILLECIPGAGAQVAPPSGSVTQGATAAETHENTVPLKSIDPDSVIAGNRALTQMTRELAGSARIEAFSLEEGVSQMNQVASLIVENREEVQGAWATSQRLEKTANELDKLVKYFD